MIYDEAITTAGINTKLLTDGQVNTNHIQIVGEDNLFYWDGRNLHAISKSIKDRYVELNSGGLKIKYGMLEVEGEAGTVIIDGKSNMHKILATGRCENEDFYC